MATIVTRAGKGAALTHQEVDANFTGLNTELGQKEVASSKGVANGYASLDVAGKVPAAQLPSYVDDVVEVANFASLPGTGETGKIYVTIDTNKTYRWTGSTYIEISASPGSTDSLAEGSTNLYFTQARARASLSASGSLNYNSSTGVISFTDAVTSVAGRTGAVTLTSSDVGLGSVENKSSATIRGELTSGNVTTALGFTPYNATNPSGYISGNQTITVSGDASGSGATSIALTLANSGVAAGTYTKVTVDAKGRVTTGASLASGDLPTYTGTITSSQVTTGLGFTPYNATNPSGYITSSALSSYLPLSGGTVSGTLSVSSAYGTMAAVKGSGFGYAPGSYGAIVLGSTAAYQTTCIGVDPIANPSGSFSGLGHEVMFRNGATFVSPNAANNGYHTYVSLTGGLANFTSTLQNSGNQVLHAANYSSYALPLSGGTITGQLTVNSQLNTGDIINLGFNTQGTVATSARRGIELHAGGGSDYWIGKRAGAWTQPLDVSFYTGIRYHAHLSHGGHRFFTGGHDSTEAFSVGNGDSNVRVVNTLFIGGNTALHSANYNSYAPTLTGTGASGTWSISTTSDFLHSDRDFPSGTLITTDINYAVSSGDPFVLEIRGNSYGNAVPLDIQYQGYIYSDTIINHGGLSNGLNISGLVAINNGGNLCFWFPSQGYWNGYYVKVYVPYSGRQRNRVTSISGSGKPTTAKEVGLSANIRQSLHSGNYTSYSPSLTGSGASGTWGISISGSAAQLNGYSSAENGASVVLRTASSGYLYLNNWIHVASSGLFSSVNGAHLLPSDSTFGAWRISGSKNGYTGISTVGSSHRINWMVDLNGNLQGWYNESYGWQMYWSGGSLTVFKNSYGGGTAATVLDSANYTSYAPSLTGSGASGSWNITAANATRANGNFYIDTNYGRGIIGLYSSYRYQGVFSMGDAYKLADDGTTTGNLYGMAWSHPNAGGAAGNLTNHGLLIINNGTFQCAISNSIVASGNITAYSDERLKKNWRDMPDNFVERLSQVRVGRYERIDDGMQQVGVSAQSLQPLLPEAIQVSNDEMKTLSVSYGNASLAAAVELAKELVALKHKVAELEARVH